MYDKAVIRRRRAVLAGLLLLSVLLLTAYFGDSGGGFVSSVQKGAGEVLAPIESGVSKIGKPFRDFANWTGDVFEAQGENEKLEAELTRLRADLAKAETDKRDAGQLRALEELAAIPSFPEGVSPVTARVIAQSPTAWYSTIQIDKGADDGIEEDQPVIGAGGLVGRVSSVSGGTAQVTLITDPTSAVSAQVVPDGARGIAKPAVGDPTDLLLDFVEKKREFPQGARLVTSGTTSSKFESLFPRGIPIGEIKKVDSDDLDIYQQVHIEPYVDLRRLDVVQVLTPGSGAKAEAPPQGGGTP